MTEKKLIKTDDLEKGMRLDQEIMDSSGRVLISKGTYIDDLHIKFLHNSGIDQIKIVFETEDDSSEVEISDETKALIEKNTVEDRHTVRLSEDIKERVGQGVQYLFDNPDSDGFAEYTANIAEALTSAITKNNAVALDINMIKVSDEYTFKHSVDVATMAMIIGKKYGLNEKQLEEIGISGLLHDLGKSKIPLEVLNKPGKLTDEEFAIMKKHTIFGYEIVKNKKQFNSNIMMGILQHHEKISGRGYPLGLTEEKIHNYAKIISVADVYDALVTERPYKKGLSKRTAVEMIMAMTGDIDMKAMQSFLKSIILYPVGSIVNLSNGEKAQVLENDINYVLRPKVIGLDSHKIYDLSNDIHCASILIL